MRLSEAFDGWQERRLSQTEAARLLGVHERTFRRYIDRYHDEGLVKKAPGRGKHRKRREPSPLPGMLIHQDGSIREWVPGQRWDLIVTMDDATNEHYSMFFVDEEGTASSFRGVAETIAANGRSGHGPVRC